MTTSKAVTFDCPHCRSIIKASAPIGQKLNVRMCYKCDRMYYIVALNETHCRMSAAASQTKMFLATGQKQKGKFSFASGGRSAGRAYAQAQEFVFTKYANANPEVVGDAEFEMGETDGNDREQTVYINFKLEGDQTDAYKHLRDMQDKGHGFRDGFDREALLRGEWVEANPNRKSPEQIKETFDKLRMASDRLKEATEKLTNPKFETRRKKKV